MNPDATTSAPKVGSSAIVRLPSLERGCKDKIKLGHKGYARNAERMAKKHGKRYAVYLCPHCGSTHLTTRLDKEYATKLLYVCKPNVDDQATRLPAPTQLTDKQ